MYFNKRKLGNFYEQEAAEYLVQHGYRIIETNWQCGRIGELDLIVIDSNRFKEEYLVFVEVKYRKEGIIAAMEAVNHRKRMQLKKLSQLYLKSRKLKEEKTNISYDVIAISSYEIRHIKNIFQY